MQADTKGREVEDMLSLIIVILMMVILFKLTGFAFHIAGKILGGILNVLHSCNPDWRCHCPDCSSGIVKVNNASQCIENTKRDLDAFRDELGDIRDMEEIIRPKMIQFNAFRMCA